MATARRRGWDAAATHVPVPAAGGGSHGRGAHRPRAYAGVPAPLRHVASCAVRQPATVPRDAHHPHPSRGNMLDTGMTRRHLLAAMAAAGLGAALPAPAAGPRGASAAARDGAAAGRRPDSIGVALVGL